MPLVNQLSESFAAQVESHTSFVPRGASLSKRQVWQGAVLTVIPSERELSVG